MNVRKKAKNRYANSFLVGYIGRKYETMSYKEYIKFKGVFYRYIVWSRLDRKKRGFYP